MNTVAEAAIRPKAGALFGELRVSLALARVEGRRMLLNPVMVVALAAAAFLLYYNDRDLAPVLNRSDILAGWAFYPIGAVTLLLSSVAAMRSSRHRTDELYRGLATSASARTVGHLLATLWPVAASILLFVAYIAYLVAHGAIGTPDVRESLVGPAMVGLGGAFGVALARWAPLLIAPPLALVGLAALNVMWSGEPGGRLIWLSPYVEFPHFPAAVREMFIRPSGWHLLYLVSAALVLCGLAMLRHGLRPTLIAATAAFLAAAVVASFAQTRPPSETQYAAVISFVGDPAEHQTCETRATIRFCAYEGYEAWIDRWTDVVTPVLARIPPSRRPESLEISQRLSSEESWGDLPPRYTLGNSDQWAERWRKRMMGSGIHPTMHWGRGPLADDYELGLALATAADAVGLPGWGRELVVTKQMLAGLQRGARHAYKFSPKTMQCHTLGQSRAAVAIWLAAQATPGARRSFEEALGLTASNLEAFGGTPTTEGVVELYSLNALTDTATGVYGLVWGNPEGHYAAQLLERPSAEVTALLSRHWAELAKPTTSTARLVELLGLEPMSSADDLQLYTGIEPGSSAAVSLFGRHAIERGVRVVSRNTAACP